ncbi:BEACH domain-containing protein [Phytophthora fragariae]|uniref:BEACH domain-containing protein n=1 Tax=Phytophthora fragariae TaxID=53985 RepID=A0A6G0LYP4_9STRA|nr:BEACH domain-containing protein [Phytophthora fragariae]
MEEVVDEKLRPLLMPGDDITDIYDCLRIDGMDSCPGVFLLCDDHVYIIDNYQRLNQQVSSTPGSVENDFALQNAQIRVTEVPQGSTTLLERRLSWRLQQSAKHSTQHAVTRSKDIHQCRFWAYEDITELHKRRYQLRHVALELFANDGRNYLVTFESPEQRELVFHALLGKCPNVQGAASGLDGVSARGDLYSQLRKLLRNTMTERWVQGDISNFAYLMHLNTLAGRSYNDLTQYPVFPWVLADYDSEVLDLTDPDVYRDLSKPMGALRREEEFRARYEGLMESIGTVQGEESADHPLGSRPFHYGTHYSSAAITLHYLMRLEPFTSQFRRLHGGKYDHADRLFTSIVGAWKSAAGFEGAQNGTQDVKELIPEFFYLPEFLENVNERTFGTSQTGVVVDDVELPPWANDSPTEFVRLNRAALESPYVSANLHHWIDLIFGFKQQGPAAVEACNVFYHLTYEGSVDLDAITDPSTKRAILDQITEFGQTPSQLFRTPHPGTMGTPAHHQRITALQASRAYSILVSGCAGGVAILWDLNRRRFIRQLPSIGGQEGKARGITAICINEVTGDIVVAAGSTFGVYNVNGALRVRLDDSVVIFQDPTAFSPVSITSLAVNRGEACEWGTEKHVVTGHADGTLCVWAYSQAGTRDQNEQSQRSRRKDDWIIELQGRHKVTPNSAITALCVTLDKRKLFTGTRDGQLSVWTASIPR